MSEKTVLYEALGTVAKLTLNRPQALNSFTRQMHHDLWAALDQAEADGQIRALVITGAGRGFCAGADLAEFDFAEGPNLVERADPGPVIDQAFNPTTRRLQHLRMPTIAVPAPPMDTPMIARCVRRRVRVLVPASLATTAW